MEVTESLINGNGGVVIVKAKPTRKVFKGATKTINKIPSALLNDEQLNNAIAALPSNYNFEIHKTIHKIRETKAKRVALQMPEGLLMFACPISDIIQKFTDADTIIMGSLNFA
jgi:2-(3-amino-3-carboxypropyl)histidine synthase